jgi:hypothetical protein
LWELVRRNFGTTCFDRAASGPAAYAAILGTALAGGFHTPLNVAAPDTNLQRIAHLLEPDIIVSAGSVGERLRAQVLSARYIDATQIMPIDQIVDPEVAII